MEKKELDPNRFFLPDPPRWWEKIAVVIGLVAVLFLIYYTASAVREYQHKPTVRHADAPLR